MTHIISLLLYWCSTLGYILLVVKILDIRPESGPAFTIFAQMVLLYIASLAGGLLPASYFLVALGLLVLIALLWRHRRSLPSYLGAMATPGLVFFLILIPVLWLTTRTWQFAKWDEFSHWGLIYKEISLTNQLPGVNTTLIFPDYPPGTALYQYFIGVLFGKREGSAYFAMGLMTLSLLISVAQRFDWKKWYLFLGVFTGAFLLFHLFNNSLKIIYVDGLQGAIFGAALAFVLTEKAPSRKTLLYLLPLLLALPLIKKSGIFFALVIGLLALIWLAFSQNDRLARLKRWSAIPVRQRIRQIIPAAVLSLVIIASPLLVMISWNLHFSALERLAGKSLTTPASISIRQLYNSFLGEPTARDTATINAFVQGLQDAPFGTNGDVTTRQVMIAFLAVILLAGLTLYEADPELKNRFFTFQGLTFISITFYFVAILVSYLYIFSEYEGTKIASFYRYIGSGMLGWGLLILGFLALPLQAPQVFSSRVRSASLLIIGASVLLLFLKTPMENYLYGPQGLINGRPIVAVIADEFKPKIEPGSRVYDIWQDTTGFEHYVMRYELSPIRVEYWGWSLGRPHRPEDVWTVDLSPADWMAQLQREVFHYVLVSQPNDAFWDRYGGLFKEFDRSTNPQLFRVTSDALVRVR